MATDREIFLAAARLTEAGTPFILITVVSTKGSSPRDAGAKMIWQPVESRGNGTGEFVGTVGGGQFEMLVAESAARVFASRGTAMEHYVLGAEAEQCCGGAMDVFLEFCGARQRLVVFGAGHVAMELVEVLKGSPFEIVIVDDRPEWNSAQRFAPPLARRVMGWEEGVQMARERPGETLACVMTCSHETDLGLLQGLLSDAKRPGLASSGSEGVPAFVGLIGSRSKRICLFGRLVSSGIDEEVVKRVQCPIGVGDTGKEPRMVAVSMAAGLLLEGKRIEAVRSGAAVGVNGTAHGQDARAANGTRAGAPAAKP